MRSRRTYSTKVERLLAVGKVMEGPGPQRKLRGAEAVKGAIGARAKAERARSGEVHGGGERFI